MLRHVVRVTAALRLAEALILKATIAQHTLKRGHVGHDDLPSQIIQAEGTCAMTALNMASPILCWNELHARAVHQLVDYLHHVALLVLPALAIAGVGLTGGKPLLRKTVPFGVAVAFCMALREITSPLPPPWDSFQPSTAIVTVVLLMEPGITLERLFVKSSQKVAGTCIGCTLAFAIAVLLELFGNDLMTLCSCCFATFTVFAALQAERSDLSYVVSVICMTCAVILFGFMTSGWELIKSQVASVLVGEVVSLLSSISFEAVCGDASNSLSLAHIVETSKQILVKASYALEFAFLSNQVRAAPAGSEHLRVLGRVRTFSAGTWERLAVDREPTVTQLRALMDPEVQIQKLGQLESDEAALETRCRACWSDITLIRSMVRLCGGQHLLGELPDYGKLPQQMHRVFVQACAMAHAAPLQPEHWQLAERHLEPLRRSLKRSIAPLKAVLDSMNSYTAKVISKADLEQLCTTLKEAQEELGMAWQLWKTRHDDSSDPGSLRRLAFFCHSLDLIIAELASFVLSNSNSLNMADAESIVPKLQAIINSPGTLAGGSSPFETLDGKAQQ